MMHPEEADWLGYFAATLVCCSFYARTIVVMRLVAITSNIAFIGYGLAKGLYPVLVLHTVLLPLNCLRLAQLRTPGRRQHSSERGRYATPKSLSCVRAKYTGARRETTDTQA